MTQFDGTGLIVDPARFHEPGYTATLRAMIERVIEDEAPIRDDLLVERIARAHGFRRSGRVIRDRVISIARAAAHLEVEDRNANFVWPNSAAVEQWSEARYPATTHDIRAIEDISNRELAAALRGCVSDDHPAEAARAFGLRRLSAPARERLRRAIPPVGHLIE